MTTLNIITECPESTVVAEYIAEGRIATEIDARRRQYEWYRDRLLRFEGVGV